MVSVRASNCLEKLGIKSIGDLARIDRRELMEAPNFGRKSLTEVEAALAEYGLRLGMATL